MKPRPIKTAPKSGISFLAYNTISGYWHPSHYDIYLKGYLSSAGFFDDAYFTHWLPMPPTPHEKKPTKKKDSTKKAKR